MAELIRSDRAASLQLSEIVKISEAARARQAEGHPVLTFGTGEPDFKTPENVIAAAHKAALAGDTGYPPTAGKPALRDAIAMDAERFCGFRPEIAEIMVSTGAKQVIHNAFAATVNPGDEVIMPAPYWTSYADIVDFCQGNMVTVPCGADQGFRLTPDALEAAITDKTRWLMLNTPGNPSGAMYSGEDLEALAEVLRKHPHVWVIADEIYMHVTYAPFTSFRKAAPDLADRTLIVNGVSKSYAMTGWRLGWGIGPVELIKAMTAIQGQCTSGASSISQAAALEALTGPQNLLAERCDAFRARRDMVVDALNAVDGITCEVPGGAFYVYPNCEGLFGRMTSGGKLIENDADVCEYILNEGNVALVPGRAFGLPGHFRLSYAYSDADLTEGCARIARAVNELKGA